MALFGYQYEPLLNLFDSDRIQSHNRKEYIPFGEDNLLPQQLVQLSRTVAVHRSLLNSKAFYISGNGFVSEDKDLKAFLELVNNQNENLKDLFFKLIFDELNTGNAYLELVTDAKKSYVQLYHIDSTKCRFATDSKSIILHPDWANYKGRADKLKETLPLFPFFEKGIDKQYHSAIHIKQYEPEFFHYGLPSWYAGLQSVIISGLTDVWNRNRLEKQFNASGMLIIPGINTVEEAEALDAEFAKFAGIENVNDTDLIIQYLKDLGPGLTRDSAQYIEFKKNEEGNWVNLHAQAHTTLLSIHNWFKSLSSFFGEKTGFDTQRILNEYEIALQTTIGINQERYTSIFKRILTFFNFNTQDLSIINESPVYRLSPVKYVWELRREMGLEFDKNDPYQKMFYSQLKNTFNAGSDFDSANTGASEGKIEKPSA